MNIFEAEDLYNPEDYCEYDIFELERDEDHVIYLEQPAYILEELNITCYEGFYCNIDNGEEMADFSLTEEPIYLADVECKIEIKEVSDV